MAIQRKTRPSFAFLHRQTFENLRLALRGPRHAEEPGGLVNIQAPAPPRGTINGGIEPCEERMSPETKRKHCLLPCRMPGECDGGARAPRFRRQGQIRPSCGACLGEKRVHPRGGGPGDRGRFRGPGMGCGGVERGPRKTPSRSRLTRPGAISRYPLPGQRRAAPGWSGSGA